MRDARERVAHDGAPIVAGDGRAPRAKPIVRRANVSWIASDEASRARVGAWSVEVARAGERWAWRAFSLGRTSRALGGNGFASRADAEEDALASLETRV